MDNENPNQPKKERRILPIVLLVLCFFASAAAGALLASSGLFDLDLKKDPIQQIDRINFDADLIKAKDKTTILIMGVDIRKDDVGRSDTMMIATINPKSDTASLLSVPRDTRVRISGYGYDKINAAFAYGGEPLAERTVENFLGINIDHYIIIDTSSFVKIIDAIGGIDIDVEKRMKYEDPWDDNGGLVIDLYPGLQHMDGKKAVTYVRYRDSEGDIGRIKRQQQFMAACMEKIMSPSFIPRIPAVLHEIFEAVNTDMTTRQLLELAGSLKDAQANGLTTDMVPGYPLYIEGVSYWIPDIEELQYAMASGLGVNVDSKLKTRVKRIADEYSESIPENIRNSRGSSTSNDSDNYSTRRQSSADSDNYSTRRQSSNDSDNYSTRRQSSNDSDNYSTRRQSSTDSDNYSTRHQSSTDNDNYSTRRQSSNDNDNYSTRPSTYEEENYSPRQSATYEEPAPQFESVTNTEIDNFDDTPTRDGDTSKDR